MEQNANVPQKITVQLDAKQARSTYMDIQSEWITFSDGHLKGRLSRSEIGVNLYLEVEHPELGYVQYNFDVRQIINIGMKQILETQDWYCVCHTNHYGKQFEFRYTNIADAIRIAEDYGCMIRIDRHIPNGTYREGLKNVNHFGGYYRD